MNLAKRSEASREPPERKQPRRGTGEGAAGSGLWFPPQARPSLRVSSHLARRARVVYVSGYRGRVATTIVKATDELHKAIWAAGPRDDWSLDDRIVADVVQGSIVQWANELGRSIMRAHSAIEEAKQHLGSELDGEQADRLEVTFFQIVSARDKLVAIAALILGVPSLRRHKQNKRSVRFEPSETAVKGALSEETGPGASQAGRLKSCLDALVYHPAVILRNQVIHAVSPLGGVTENCWIRIAYLDDKGGIIHWDRGPLYPEGTLNQGDLRPETIWTWAIREAEGAVQLLVEATKALACMTAANGTFAPPQSVYRWPSGEVELARP